MQVQLARFYLLFIVFDAQQLNALWTMREIAGTHYGGWTDSEIFQGWLKEHSVTHAVREIPLLLHLDGHSSHFDVMTINFVKECNISHTIHEAQPLDISFIGPHKKH